PPLRVVDLGAGTGKLTRTVAAFGHDVVAVEPLAEMLHWFDQEAALAEIARVLRPRGAVGLLWNTRDDDEPWVARLSELIGSEAEWDHEPPEPLAASTQFGDVERRVFRHVQRFDRSTLIDLIASRSFAATMDPPEREKLLAAVGRIHDESAEAAGGAELELPYRTYAFRATRL
ncbi:MAG: class I SAM-dependent methyltransferase, partial [Actinomycetota bacterium]|nr:class I SAM-dependent methyltransferase [Actinomycetota bacterium]